MTGRCLTPYPTDSQHWCSRSFGHSGAHVNTTIDATWLDDTPAAVVDVPVDSPAYRLINELTAERDTLEKILSKERSRVTAALIECDREYPIGRVPLDEVPTPAQICERIRAALTLEQPA